MVAACARELHEVEKDWPHTHTMHKHKQLLLSVARLFAIEENESIPKQKKG